MQRPTRWLALACAATQLCFASGCASHESWQARTKRWSLRTLGAIGAFGLHEACHVAVGAAFGADVDAAWEGGLVLRFGGMSQTGHQAVAIAGNACTGAAAELILWRKWHRRHDFAWGMAAFHAANSMGYAFTDDGDKLHWVQSGGDETAWTAAHAVHGARVGSQLAWEAGVGDWVINVFRAPPPPPDHVPLPLPRRVRHGGELTAPSRGVGSEIDRTRLPPVSTSPDASTRPDPRHDFAPSPVRLPALPPHPTSPAAAGERAAWRPLAPLHEHCPSGWRAHCSRLHLERASSSK